MNNRLTIQDLAGLLAEYTGKDKKNTERFLREFIQIVTEGVYADKLVKVKGLGTFKVIPVEKRESIHVHTGEHGLSSRRIISFHSFPIKNCASRSIGLFPSSRRRS